MEITIRDQSSLRHSPGHFGTGNKMVRPRAGNKCFSKSMKEISRFKTNADKKNKKKRQRRVSVSKI